MQSTYFYNHGKACNAINCSNNKKNSPGLSFFRFPKDPERCRKWLINSRRDDLSTRELRYINNNVRLCSVHFEDNQFMNSWKKKLVWNAVPTIFDVSNEPLKRKLPTRIDVPVPIPKKRKLPVCIDLVDPVAVPVPIPKKRKLPECIDLVDPVPICSTEDPCTYPTGGPNPAEILEDGINKLSKIVYYLRRQCKYKSAEIERLKRKCRELKKSKCDCNCKQNISRKIISRRKHFSQESCEDR